MQHLHRAPASNLRRTRNGTARLGSVLVAAALTAPLAAQDPSRFPPLPPATDGAIDLPTTTATPDAPLRWRPVGDGADAAATDTGLRITYRRAGRAAYGAALAFRPGGLAGLTTLELEFGGGGKGATVLVSLRKDAGGVHSWTPTRLTGERQTLRLAVDAITADAFQNTDGPPGPFAAERAAILSITDIGGYFGAKQEDVDVSLKRARAFVGETAPDDASAAGAAPPSAGFAQFVAALVHGEGEPDAALRALLVEALREPSDPEPYLWLGLNHLWLAAEGDRSDPRTLEHAVLADRWFELYTQAGGRDPRVPSWSVPARLTIVSAFGDAVPEADDPMAPLRAAYREDPGFHGFAMGLVGFGTPTDSKPFADGLAAVRATLEVDRDDVSVQNQPHWPHNVEGFLLFAADYEHRAGEPAKARALLDRIERVDGFADWPFRDEVARRRELWDRGESVDHGGGWMRGNSCVICHRGS